MNTAPSTRRIIVLDASPGGTATMARVGAFILPANAVPHALHEISQPGHDGIGAMPALLAEVLEHCGWTQPDLVVVSVGPGSFTGLRTACALAAGLAFGAQCTVIGVTRGEALAEALRPTITCAGLDGWLAVYTARRGRWFIESGDADGVTTPAHAVTSAAWHPPAGQWLLAGDAAAEAMAGDRPPSAHVTRAVEQEAALADYAVVGIRRADGVIAARAPLPLYVDKPEAALPAGGLRATPQ